MTAYFALVSTSVAPKERRRPRGDPRRRRCGWQDGQIASLAGCWQGSISPGAPRKRFLPEELGFDFIDQQGSATPPTLSANARVFMRPSTTSAAKSLGMLTRWHRPSRYARPPRAIARHNNSGATGQIVAPNGPGAHGGQADDYAQPPRRPAADGCPAGGRAVQNAEGHRRGRPWHLPNAVRRSASLPVLNTRGPPSAR